MNLFLLATLPKLIGQSNQAMAGSKQTEPEQKKSSVSLVLLVSIILLCGMIAFPLVLLWAIAGK